MNVFIENHTRGCITLTSGTQKRGEFEKIDVKI